jgi:hypothetical protein
MDGRTLPIATPRFLATRQIERDIADTLFHLDCELAAVIVRLEIYTTSDRTTSPYRWPTSNIW